MKIFHLYPRTVNIGDHFVRIGIEALLRCIVPGSEFTSLNVNDRGDDRSRFGLTEAVVRDINQQADIVVIGGSNLYEGRTTWGVHLELAALDQLNVPLLLLGIGTGSPVLTWRIPAPVPKVLSEIRRLNSQAIFSGVRDVVTYQWLRQLGISNVELFGDPATFIFNREPQPVDERKPILFVSPPMRLWNRGIRRSWDWRGRQTFTAMAMVARQLASRGNNIMVACNDPRDETLANMVFRSAVGKAAIVPKQATVYFDLLAGCRLVVTGRLHTAVVAFSLGIPFVLIDVDQRTNGFIETYGLRRYALRPRWLGMRDHLLQLTLRALESAETGDWMRLVEARERMYQRALAMLERALRAVA